MAIIQPFQKKKIQGPPIVRIVIEMDGQGQASVDVRNLQLPMSPVPMITASAILSSVLNNFITLMMQGKNAGMESNEITSSESPTDPPAAG